MRRALPISLVVGMSWACGPQVTIPSEATSDGEGDVTSTSVGGDVPTPPPSTSGTPVPGTSGPSLDSGDVDVSDDGTCNGGCGCNFLQECDMGGYTPIECDVWAQDCPDGEKCMPWADDGGPHWNATRCSPVGPGGAVGDPCEVEGSPLSGIDTCGVGLWCAWVDPTTLQGTCVSMCGGDVGNPQCEDPDDTCFVGFEGTVTLCLPSCDLLEQDCPDGQGACYRSTSDFSAACGVPLLPAAGISEGCEYDWDCAPGSVCHPAAGLGMCAADHCCTALCDVTAPVSPCPPGEFCASLWPEGEAPPQFYDEGQCELP
jgi:hypothetical protein